MDFYIYRNAQRVGPYTVDQIQEMLNSEEISTSDLCWHDGLPNFAAISTVFELETIVYSPPQAAQVKTKSSSRYRWHRRALKGHPNFEIRLIAFVIDLLILCLMMYLTIPAYALPYFEQHEITGVTLILSVIGLSLVTGWLYFALMECLPFQATVGKKLCGFIVTDMNGRRIGFFRASIRYVGLLISIFSLGYGFLMCTQTRNRQCLQDRMAGCLMYVV